MQNKEPGRQVRIYHILTANPCLPIERSACKSPGGVQDIGGDCDVWGSIVRAAVILNPVRNPVIFQAEKKKKKTNILTIHML